jgi:tetratricopeptide (TPR) repeat protein
MNREHRQHNKYNKHSRYLTFIIAATALAGYLPSVAKDVSKDFAGVTAAQEIASLRNPIYTGVPNTAANKTLPIAQLNAAMETRNFDRVDALIARVRDTPTNTNAVSLWRGLAYWGHQRYEEAVEQFDRCKNFDDAALERLYIVGSTYFKLEECSKAVKVLSLVIARYPSRDCYSNRANCYVALKKHREAIADFFMAAKLSYTYHSAYLSRAANIQRVEKQFDQAISTYTEALKNSAPNFMPTAYLGRALCYQELGKWEAAAQDCTAAIKVLNTTYTSDMKTTLLSDGYVQRAKCYDHLGKASLAAADRQAHAQIGSALAKEFLEK